jgi:hypothetical protein
MPRLSDTLLAQVGIAPAVQTLFAGFYGGCHLGLNDVERTRSHTDGSNLVGTRDV